MSSEEEKINSIMDDMKKRSQDLSDRLHAWERSPGEWVIDQEGIHIEATGMVGMRDAVRAKGISRKILYHLSFWGSWPVEDTMRGLL